MPTETGKRSVKLQLNTNNRIQLCNETSIEVSDNKSIFSINKLITSKSTFEIPEIEGLQMPREITIDKQYHFQENDNDWPHIAINTSLTLPILSLAPYGIRKLVLPVEQMIIKDRQPSLECPDIPSKSVAMGTQSGSEIQDHINYVQAACAVLTLLTRDIGQQEDLNMYNISLKSSSAAGDTELAGGNIGP